MEENIYKQRNFELRMIVGVIGLMLLLLGGYTQKIQDEKAGLKAGFQQLESSFQEQQQSLQQRFDSLQQHIAAQETLHLQLKDSMATLQDKRHYFKTRSDENKAAIARLRDADSLRDAVARHYQR